MKKLSTIAAALLLPQAALAHSGHDSGHFLVGLAHPAGGADHLLAMVGLGLLAAQLGGRAVWSLPAAFLAAMVAGAAAGWAGLILPGIEPMILASVVVLGVLVAMAARLPLAALLPGAALFGLAHGFAHGAEGPAEGLVAYGAGFAVMTLGLHLLGIGAGRLLRKAALLRGLGGGTALAGLVLAVGG